MKTKIIAYTLAMFICLGLTGCGGGNDNKNEGTQTQNREDNTSVSNGTSNANPTESPNNVKNHTKEELLAMPEDAETLYTFEEVDGGVRIIAYNGKSDVAIVPNTIDGKNVIILGSNSFRFDKGIKAVLLPPALISIESEAFMGCENLVAVYSNGDKIKTVGDGAFAGVGDLSVEFPDSIDDIDGFPFIGKVTVITPKDSYSEQYLKEYDFFDIVHIENN